MPGACAVRQTYRPHVPGVNRRESEWKFETRNGSGAIIWGWVFFSFFFLFAPPPLPFNIKRSEIYFVHVENKTRTHQHPLIGTKTFCSQITFLYILIYTYIPSNSDVDHEELISHPRSSCTEPGPSLRIYNVYSISIFFWPLSPGSVNNRPEAACKTA